MIRLEIRKSKQLTEEFSIYASFPYDPEIVNLFRTFPYKYYHTETKEWELPGNKLDDIIDTFADHRFPYKIETNDLIHQLNRKNKIPEDYKFKTDPFSHQKEAIEFGLNHKKWLLGDSMGLGKTKVAIDLACIRKQMDGYKHCLIICGVNSLKWNWVNEVKIHSDEDCYILGQRGSGDNIHIDSNEDKFTDIRNLNENKAYFIITNIETLRDDKCAVELRKCCLNDEIGMIVLDEAHACKNPLSQQGKGMLKLSADTMLAMTGTPLMNSPLDLYFIMRWLGYEMHSFYQFKQYHCVMGGYGGYEIIGYKNMNQLQSKLKDFMIRRLKEDVFDLPDKIYVNEYVEMGLKQKQIYKEIRQDIVMNIDKIVMSNHPLTELIRLRQATGYTGILSNSIQESAKLDRMEELVEEAVSNNQKVVIFSNWVQITDQIYARLHPKYHPAIITGDTDPDSRKDEIWHFQNDDQCKVIIGTIGAMGTGITLTAGTVEIFIDEPWTMAAKEQAVDRCHRIGTKDNITIYTLLTKNTIDEKIHAIIEKKGVMADAIVDNRILGDKRELIKYLIDSNL